MKSPLRIIGLLALGAALSLSAADLTPKNAGKPAPEAGQYDPLIARTTANMLERFHYLQQPLDDEVSSRFLTDYLDSLDSQRLFFLRGDADEFEQYRHKLDDLVSLKGDTSPAYTIFSRFLKRIDERYAFTTNFLETAKFEFTGNERVLVNRKTAPYPKDAEEANQVWRDRLRNEYLAEKRNYDKPKPKAKSPGAIKLIPDLKDGKKVDVETTPAPEPPAKVLTKEEIHQEIINTLLRRYSRILRNYHDMDSDDVLQFFLTALTHAYDPHSDYMNKQEADNFNISMKLSLFGIGAVLRSEDGFCRIVSLQPEGPADKSKKVKPEDKIIAVAQGTNQPVDVVEMKLAKVVDLIRGPKGSEVRLTVVPVDAPDTRKVVPLIRDQIKLEDQAAKGMIYEMPAEGGKTIRLGVVDLPSFYADFDADPRKSPEDRVSTTADVAKLVRKLKEEKIEGLILDLRRNGGGSLEEAINLTGLFIKEGPVVQVKDSTGQIIVDADTDPGILYDGPMIVLTSRFSASASEILAGALQDYGRAVIVGDSSTHGKGTVQQVIDLKQVLRRNMPANPDKSFDPGQVKVTIRKFYRPSGASTQLKGVVPDVELPSINSYAEGVGESALDNPLKYDVIRASKFEKLNRVQPYLEDLKKHTLDRIAKEKDFDYIRDDIGRFKQMLADRTVSLNEADRKKELKENEDRVKARRKELAARPDPNEKVYELSLKQAVQAGLPTPTPRLKGATKSANPRLPKTDEEMEEEEDKAPIVDAVLDETRRILLDYIHLQAKPAVARNN